MLTFAFAVGAFVGALISWVVWTEWAFWWTAKNNLRADLFTLSPDEVRDELSTVVRHQARISHVTSESSQ